MSAWDGLVTHRPTSTITYPAMKPPEGFEWTAGRCPNEGRLCNCPGTCRPKLTPVGYRGRHRKDKS